MCRKKSEILTFLNVQNDNIFENTVYIIHLLMSIYKQLIQAPNMQIIPQ